MILAVDPFSIARIGLFIKNNWKPILISVLAIVLFIMMIPAAILNILFPSAEPDLAEEYKEISKETNVDWTEMLIYDMVRYENDYERANPKKTAFDFIEVNYKKKAISTWEDNEGNSHTRTRTVATGTLKTPRAFNHYIKEQELKPIKYKEDDASEFIEAVKSKDGATKSGSNIEYEYFFTIVIKDLPQVLEEKKISEDKKEWAMEILKANVLHEMYGDIFDLPENIPVLSNGFFAWPTPTLKIVTSQYGQRVLNGKTGFHYGIDISGANALGQPIIAMADGEVFQVNYSNGDAGYNVRIRHYDDEGNEWQTRYAHMSYIKTKVGDKVDQGDVIGSVGNTGKSTGPHLHLEIKFEGGLVNPYPLIKNSN